MTSFVVIKTRPEYVPCYPVCMSARATIDEVRERFNRFVHHGEAEDSCWGWTGRKGSAGYGEFKFWQKKHGTHRLSYELSIGEIPDGLCVLHRCDNRLCVNPSHLFVGSKGDNNRDRSAKGRSAKGDRHWSRLHPDRIARGERSGAKTHPECIVRGERQGSAVLTESNVREIRRLASDGETPTALALRFGVGRSTVRRVLDRATWSHIE